MYGANSPNLNPGDYAVYERLYSTACIALPFPAWTISKTVRTCWEIIDKSTDHWSDKLKAVV